MNTFTRKQYQDSDSFFLCSACKDEVRTVRYLYFQNGKIYKIYRCKICGFMFARPIFIPELQDRQMDSIEDAELFHNSFLKRLHEKFIIHREIRNVRRILGQGDYSLLDIGCGTGWTTKIWKDSGFNVTGLEPSEARGKVAQEKYGIKIIPDYFENLKIAERFELIIIRHVAEHLEDPCDMLLKMRTLLDQDGLILVIVPNINSIGRYFFGTKWSWILPYHCNFFNPKSLRRLLNTAGFDVLKIYQTPSPLWYPESFSRLFSSWGSVLKCSDKLSLLSLFLSLPLVGLGYLTHFSDNITAIARINNAE